MALSRKMLKAMSIEDEKVDQIIEAHSETVDALKDQMNQYKADAEKLHDVQKELDALKATDGKEDTYKVKFEELKKDFDDYKESVAKKETTAKKMNAYKALLKEAGISEKRHDVITKVADLDTITLDDDGNITGKDDLLNSIKSEWADFITDSNTTGASTATPPAGSGKTYKTKEEIMAISDTAERQAAIAENHELFGF